MNAATASSQNQGHLSVFLLGAILNILAAVDYTSLIDYSVKALVGGIIWLGFKIVGDLISRKISKKQKE